MAQQKQEEAAKRVQRIGELKEKFGIPKALKGDDILNALEADELPGKGTAEEGRELARLTREQQAAEKQKEEAQKGPGGGAAPGQGPIRITGVLTIRADGSAIIEAEGGLPVN